MVNGYCKDKNKMEPSQNGQTTKKNADQLVKSKQAHTFSERLPRHQFNNKSGNARNAVESLRRDGALSSFDVSFLTDELVVAIYLSLEEACATHNNTIELNNNLFC